MTRCRWIIDGHSLYEYGFLLTKPYAEDTLVKYTGYIDRNGKYQPGLFDQLDQAGYIILSSNRVYGSATRLPMRYPALTRYYHYLFSGELGFEQVADITSYPSLFGIAIPDQGAEEAWSVYDHPRVLIFKKTSAYSRARAAQLIAGDIAWDEVYQLPTALVSRVPTALRLTESAVAGLSRRRQLGRAVRPGAPGEPDALAGLAAGAGADRAGGVPAAVPHAARPARSRLCAGQDAGAAAGGVCRLAAGQLPPAGVHARQRLAVRRAADCGRRAGRLAQRGVSCWPLCGGALWR